MNQLHLRLYNPPPESETPEPTQKRDILPFVSRTQTKIISGRLGAPVDRARVLRQNSVCPECSQMNVEPLELQDAVISPKSRLPVPGTATIVGFHCNDCSTEWPVYELVTRRNG
ncbi:MAG: hypothetical protein GY758_04465 [Fuerstiella sp.]|jgi:hypothetical protein|nr:hypothetical protein [Fuerstiella sp.]MCP4510185.1 hypothetical protein [Fuerstiella sp.]MDG2128308.1 hypothetical protein [Fuerstiella sp.]